MENTESLKTPEWFESVEDAVVVNNGGWGGGSLLQSWWDPQVYQRYFKADIFHFCPHLLTFWVQVQRRSAGDVSTCLQQVLSAGINILSHFVYFISTGMSFSQLSWACLPLRRAEASLVRRCWYMGQLQSHPHRCQPNFTIQCVPWNLIGDINFTFRCTGHSGCDGELFRISPCLLNHWKADRLWCEHQRLCLWDEHQDCGRPSCCSSGCSKSWCWG